jgi:hypothetical protein
MPYPTPGVKEMKPVNDLRMIEYAIVSSSVETPNHIEFNDRLPVEVRARREKALADLPVQQLKDANTELRRFGYQLIRDTDQPEGSLVYTLYHNKAILVKGISSFQPVLLNSTGSDFVMGFDLSAGGSMLLQAGGSAHYDPSLHCYTWPVYAGINLVSVETRLDNPDRIYVMSGGKEVFSYAILPAAVKNPVDGLWSWNGQWFLGVNSRWIVDGKPFNPEASLDETYGWQVLMGQPFYFFTKMGKTGISWGGQPLPVEYDEVVHGMCCEASAFNPVSGSKFAWFYARLLGTWYYVELTHAH